MAILSPLYRMVARDFAIGISLEDIAELRNLPMAEVKRVAEGATFQKAVEKIQIDIDAALVQEEASDPIRALLKAQAKKSVTRLSDEVDSDNKEGGACATTRIKAANSILTMLGYGKQEAQTNLAVIMLSPDKLKSVNGFEQVTLDNVPDLVDG